MDEFETIYSENLDKIIVEYFYVRSKTYGYKKYVWNDEDLLYYWEEADDDFYMEVPRHALPNLNEILEEKRKELMKILDEQDERKDLSYRSDEEKKLMKEILEIEKEMKK